MEQAGGTGDRFFPERKGGMNGGTAGQEVHRGHPGKGAGAPGFRVQRAGCVRAAGCFAEHNPRLGKSHHK
nr:MAG TPA: hypothetical protein [Caudoviricetes sp.]